MAGDGDRGLGSDRPITRRDFLDGAAIAFGAAAAAATSAGMPEGARAQAAAPYPPALTGPRGSTDGALRDGHALRDTGSWTRAGAPAATGERYDLVVVGGGISGLAAAHAFRRQAGDAARILVLDNHDDFGGHARRNEFTVDGRTLIGYGGTASIDSPGPFSAAARALIAELGIDVARWQGVHEPAVYAGRGLGQAIFFDRETFGADALVRFAAREAAPDAGDAASEAMWSAFLAAAPLAPQAKADLKRLHAEPVDHLPGLSSAAKKARLARISYADFLTGVAGVHGDVVKLLQSRAKGYYGVGIDAVPAQDAWGLGLPGFRGMGLEPGFGPGMNHDAKAHPDGGPAYFFHFPDGNASIARLLVRRLVPAALPGDTADDIVTARCDYGRLDEAASPVRIRLEATAVRVAHAAGPGAAGEVEIAYVRGGRLQAVRAGRCILACWHSVIPWIAPELPRSQRIDLAYGVKVPIVYTNVALRHWRPFVAAGASRIHCPGAFHSSMSLDHPVAIGGYRPSRGPDEPVLVHLARTPCKPGLPAREQHRAGREELLAMPFEEFERRTRDQLARALGPFGLDPAQDIAAITVNRWAHGYAYQYNSLFDPFWLEGGETPADRARRPFRRIAIANADAAAYSYTDAAIDAGLRAVAEVTSAP